MSSARTETLYSIGYEGRSVDDFLSTLLRHRIEVVVDVRENATSRKPGFSKRTLTEELNRRGIYYLHQPALGNPKSNRGGFRNGRLDSARRAYLSRLNDQARDAYEEVLLLASMKRTLLLCYEREEERCHRSCIIDQARKENPLLAVLRL